MHWVFGYAAIGFFEITFVHLNSCADAVILHPRHHIKEVSHHRESSPVCVAI